MPDNAPVSNVEIVIIVPVAQKVNAALALSGIVGGNALSEFSVRASANGQEPATHVVANGSFDPLQAENAEFENWNYAKTLYDGEFGFTRLLATTIDASKPKVSTLDENGAFAKRGPRYEWKDALADLGLQRIEPAE